MKRMKLLLLPALMLMSGCGPKAMTSTPTPTATTAISFVPCSDLRVVRLSKYDTAGTKEQVIPQNEVIVSVCGVPHAAQ